jgi:hypothetical protein
MYTKNLPYIYIYIIYNLKNKLKSSINIRIIISGYVNYYILINFFSESIRFERMEGEFPIRFHLTALNRSANFL